MTADAVGFQAAWATSDCELRRSSWCVLRAIGQILQGFLLQREFCQIGFHVGSLVQSGRWNGPKTFYTHTHLPKLVTQSEIIHLIHTSAPGAARHPALPACLMDECTSSRNIPVTPNKNRRHTARRLNS